MPAYSLPNKLKADPTKWSKKSQRSVAADFTTQYTDIKYRCWHCQAEAIFSAIDQKQTFEIKKANINQRRILCQICWKKALHLSAELRECEAKWNESKHSLKTDEIFLSNWLLILVEQETYLYRHDTARKNMLRKLLRNAKSCSAPDDPKEIF